MKDIYTIKSKLILTCIVILVWVILFTSLAKYYGALNFWALMLIGASAIAFFAILALPGGIAPDGTIKESRIRFAIAGSLMVVYLVYFGSVAYLDYVAKDAQDGATETFAITIMPTLSNLLMVTVSFYFGSTAAIEIANTVSKRNK